MYMYTDIFSEMFVGNLYTDYVQRVAENKEAKLEIQKLQEEFHTINNQTFSITRAQLARVIGRVTFFWAIKSNSKIFQKSI